MHRDGTACRQFGHETVGQREGETAQESDGERRKNQFRPVRWEKGAERSLRMENIRDRR